MVEFITREELTTRCPRRYKDCEVVFNGKKRAFRVQSLTELEQSTYESEVSGSRDYRQSKRKLIVLCLVDASNKRMLNESDVSAMEELDGATVQQMFSECLEWIQLSQTDFEQLVKNSDATGDA